jgi:hypothetical protein
MKEERKWKKPFRNALGKSDRKSFEGYGEPIFLDKVTN